MRYGYARVSTKDQCVDRQFKALEDSGIRKGCIYAVSYTHLTLPTKRIV